MLKLLPTRVMRAFAALCDHWRLFALVVALLLFAAIMWHASKVQPPVATDSSESP
jgi:uncharacterized protein involved in exopolysaccharide biosynthesis